MKPRSSDAPPESGDSSLGASLTRLRGALIGGARVVVPGVLLALIPKCPACLAAYVALSTGIGVSFAVAEWLRIGLIAACVLALVVGAGVWLRQRCQRPSAAPAPQSG